MDRARRETLPNHRRINLTLIRSIIRWRLTRNEAAFLAAIIVYAILVVVVTPLLLGFLPILAVGWMLRIPVASDPADTAAVQITASEPVSAAVIATEPVESDSATPVPNQYPKAPDEALSTAR